MPRRPKPLPPGLRPGAFTVAQAARLGAGPERLRRADAERIGYGVYRLRGATTTELDLAAALLDDLPGAVLSGRSAARARGFPLPQDLQGWSVGDPIEVTIPPWCSPTHRADIVTRRAEIPEAHRRRFQGVPITSCERTWLDLAADLDLPDLVSIGDHLVRVPRPELEGRIEPFSTPDLLAAVVEDGAGRPGVRSARAALGLVRIGADSPRETELRLALGEAGVPEPLLNVPIVGPGGRLLHEPDLQWPRFRVAAEYEGEHHRTPEQIARDIDRAETIRRIEWREVRIVAPHMSRGADEAVHRIVDALVDGGWHGRP
ncbi:hypothetical protein [Brachybacterium phenoliresistens]|uniref:hypothetical protein n=1 Tax=Brachybacterium phenoliresistens TaxID=396014 RepID=UPI0031CDC9DE